MNVDFHWMVQQELLELVVDLVLIPKENQKYLNLFSYYQNNIDLMEIFFIIKYLRGSIRFFMDYFWRIGYFTIINLLRLTFGNRAQNLSHKLILSIYTKKMFLIWGIIWWWSYIFIFSNGKLYLENNWFTVVWQSSPLKCLLAFFVLISSKFSVSSPVKFL